MRATVAAGLTFTLRMLRRPLLLLSLAAPLAAGAQALPDTTSPERYFPMAVGDVWEYERAGLIEGFERRAVVGDTVIGSDTYLRYRIDYFDLDGAPSEPRAEILLRFDPASASLTTPGADPNAIADRFLTTCPLDSDFFAELFDCPGSAVVLTSGGPETVFVGADSVQTTVKYFDDNSREIFGAYAADIGFIGFTLRTGALTLAYASVGGTTYGSPIPVASAPSAPAGSRLRILAGPNPTDGAATLLVSLPDAGPVVIEAWDGLGRRVHYDAAVRPAGEFQSTLPSARWRPGAYLVRVIAGDDVAVARVTRR
jgi:hypothetical protein